MKKTPLYNRHVEAGAKMAEFGGWMMPIQYTGVLKEHAAVRSVAGVFDVSHMGEIVVEGGGAENFVNRLVTNDVSKLKKGDILYTPICRENGGVIDDLLVYRLDELKFMLVVNASNTEKDFKWIISHADDSVDIKNVSDDYGLIALQGPKALEIFNKLARVSETLGYYTFYETDLGGAKIIVSRTGYTGEDGLEIYLTADKTVSLWDALMEAGKDFGLSPAGLAARDLLRIEAGYPLYGHELDEDTDPVSAGLKWAVKMDAADFIGKSSLIDLKPAKKKIGVVMEGRSVPRQGYPIIMNGEKAGVITSGTFSPVLQKPVGIGYIFLNKNLGANKLKRGNKLSVEIRGKEAAGEICRMPFIPSRTAGK
ncbi:MAG: glycine cleavage system aminomethyltransferase GcvT [Nitrospinota bacterium]